MYAAEYMLFYWKDLRSVLGQEVLASVAGPAAGVATGCQAASPVIEAIHTCHKKIHQARQIGQSHRAKQPCHDRTQHALRAPLLSTPISAMFG